MHLLDEAHFGFKIHVQFKTKKSCQVSITKHTWQTCVQISHKDVRGDDVFSHTTYLSHEDVKVITVQRIKRMYM
jgi:hypothetical protein